jgi:hypothetical protein
MEITTKEILGLTYALDQSHRPMGFPAREYLDVVAMVAKLVKYLAINILPEPSSEHCFLFILLPFQDLLHTNSTGVETGESGL